METRNHQPPPPIGPRNITGVLKQVRISQVWTALGGGPLRSNRGRAFWRDGDGLTISLDDTKGCYYDHRDNADGGILDLIQLVRGWTRSEAAEWLFDLAGVERPQLSQAAKAQWRRGRAAAAAEASDFTRWRRDTEHSLRCNLVIACGMYHRAKKWLIDHEAENQTPRWEFMMRMQNDSWADFQRHEAMVEAFRKESTPELLARFRRQRRDWFFPSPGANQ